MLNETLCTLGDRRDETLIAYLYDEIALADREAFSAHLTVCPVCLAELSSLSNVRADLAAWAAPEPAVGVGGETPRVGPRLVAPPAATVPATAPGRLPVWMQTAAAVVFFAAALGAANLEISYSESGFSVRTGWLHGTPSSTPAVQPAAPAAAEAAPWRADLASLEQQLRSDMQTRATTASSAEDEEALVRRVRAIVADSEKRQQRELALRVAEVVRETQVQRQADLSRIDRSLGLIQSRTGVEVMRTQQQLNSLAQRVSQRP